MDQIVFEDSIGLMVKIFGGSNFLFNNNYDIGLYLESIYYILGFGMGLVFGIYQFNTRMIFLVMRFEYELFGEIVIILWLQKLMIVSFGKLYLQIYGLFEKFFFDLVFCFVFILIELFFFFESGLLFRFFGFYYSK